MNCPKCYSSFEEIKIDSVEIDRCKKCKGIWFDLDETEKLKKINGSHKADTGHAAIGEYYNMLKDVKCPKCDIAMKTKIIKRRGKIHYEFCSSCLGAYFDAGEFRDFCEPTILEFVKNIFTK